MSHSDGRAISLELLASFTAYFVIESMARFFFIASAGLRINYFVRHIPLKYLYSICYAITIVISLCVPLVPIGVALRIRNSSFTENWMEVFKAVFQNIALLLMQQAILSYIAILKPGHLDKLVDLSHIHERPDAEWDAIGLILPVHFFGGVTMLSLAALLLQKGRRAVVSFAFQSFPLINYYVDLMKQAFGYRFHGSVNVTGSCLTDALSMARDLKQGSIGILFGDFRLSKGVDDFPYRLGADQYFSNSGAFWALKKTNRPLVLVVTTEYSFTDGKFFIRGKTIKKAEVLSHYYSEILPELVQRNYSQWQLWYCLPCHE